MRGDFYYKVQTTLILSLNINSWSENNCTQQHDVGKKIQSCNLHHICCFFSLGTSCRTGWMHWAWWSAGGGWTTFLVHFMVLRAALYGLIICNKTRKIQNLVQLDFLEMLHIAACTRHAVHVLGVWVVGSETPDEMVLLVYYSTIRTWWWQQKPLEQEE